MKRYLATFAAGAFFPSLVVLAGGMHAAAPEPSTTAPVLLVHLDQDVPQPVTVELPSEPAAGTAIAVTAANPPSATPLVHQRGTMTTLAPAPAHIAANVDHGVELTNQDLARTPGAVATMTQAAAEHGLAAFAYDVPEVKKQTDEIGRLIGGSLRAFAEALRDDMVKTARESGVGRKP